MSQQSFADLLVSALAQSGVEIATISPGSRNTPLTLALARAESIRDSIHHDERSAGFFALGAAKATGRPAVVTCTSGTAAAEFHPAVAEAAASRTPLIVITADRPERLFDVDAPQTIDQRGLFGSHVLWTHEVADPSGYGHRAAAALGARLGAEAGTGGPVHLDVRFDEPLVDGGAATVADVPGPVVELGTSKLDQNGLSRLAERLSGRCGVVVVGPDGATGPAAAAFGAAVGWPVVADPLSGARHGLHDRGAVMAAGDLLAASEWAQKAGIEVVLRVGGTPTSKPWWRWLGEAEVEQIVVAEHGWPDHTASASMMVRAGGAALLSSLADAVAPAPHHWLEVWHDADERAANAATDTLPGDLCEPAVARAVVAAAADDGLVVVGSSMPIRDLDRFGGSSGKALRILGNRGAAGIDGLVSMAMGAVYATDSAGQALIGDLSFLHDVGALATLRRLDLPLRIVVVDNDGGGIFHFLGQSELPEFERYFGTPHGADLDSIARGFGLPSGRVTSSDELASVLAEPIEGPSVVVVPTDRSDNHALQRRVVNAVTDALA